ncbi:MAG: GNAT family N-acetyltransferase [Actinomycetota bacterium]
MDVNHCPRPPATAGEHPFHLAAVPADRIPEAALVAASAMRDNPLHVAALGPDPSERTRIMRAVFERHLANPRRAVRAVWSGGSIVGVAAFTEPGDCRPAIRDVARLLPVLGATGRRTLRLLEWQRAWARFEPASPHVHLGPVAVATVHQRRGVGSMLLREHTARLDATGQRGYLETDKAENVRFYEAHGYVVTGSEQVIGVQSWFMSRDPSATVPGDLSGDA